MFSFALPDTPLLSAFGLLLLLGVVGGHAAFRLVRLPRICGYIAVGLLLGELMGAESFLRTAPFMALALAMAMFEVGRRVDLRWIVRERALAWSAVLTTLLVGVVLTGFLIASGQASAQALLLASLGMGSAPAIILSIIRENRAEGMVTDRLLALTALGNMIGFVTFTLAHAWLLLQQGAAIEAWLLQPAWRLLVAVALGLAAAWLAIQLARWMGPAQRLTRQTLLLGLIALIAGLSEQFGLLPAVAALTLGLAVRNLDTGYALADPGALTWTPILFLGLFVVIGMQIDLRLLPAFGVPAAGYLLLRFAAFALVLLPTARASALGPRRAFWLAVGLTPLSSGALGLYALAGSWPDAPAAHGMLLSVLALSGLIGPVLSKLALDKTGETQREMN